MKTISALMALLVASITTALAQANFSAVMADTNGVIQRPTNVWAANSNSIVGLITNRALMVNSNGLIERPLNFLATNKIVTHETSGSVSSPTNFWAANSNAINAVISNPPPSFRPSDLAYKIEQSPLADLTTQAINAEVGIVSGVAAGTIQGTNTTAVAAMRLISRVNAQDFQGAGTLFGNDSHIVWVRIEGLFRENGFARLVLGRPNSQVTNLAEYPENRAFGFEVRNTGGTATNEIRLIAHNGTTNTNGPWVAFGSPFARQTIGVEQNKSNGQVRLWLAQNMDQPALNTNATISGGPTNNAASSHSSLDIGLFTTNTNSASIGLRIHSALVEITD